MKDQINTIRRAVEAALSDDQPYIEACKQALTALDQIEKMVGEQEPVAWRANTKYGWVHSLAENRHLYEVVADWEPLYAAPVAQQYEAGDVASAAAQGFRDGVASVTQQEPVAWLPPISDLWTWSDSVQGYRTEKAGWVPVFAAPVAQHPQTEPDDETLKERDDAEDFIDMLLDEVLGTDRPEWTSAYGRDDALRDVQERMTALHKPMVDKAWGRFEKAQQPSKATLEKLRAWETSGELIDRAWRVLQSQEKEIMRLEKMLAEERAQQPQAEAVPLPQQVMVDMVPPATARDRWMYEQGRLAERDPRTHAASQQAEAVPWAQDDLDGVVEALWRVIEIHYNAKQPFHNPVYADARMAHRILVGYLPYMKYAAIAQQKGQPCTPQQAEAVPNTLQKAEAQLLKLIGEYWALAYAEGEEGRNHDTEDGAAQRTHAAIAKAVNDLIAAASSAPQHAEAVPSDDLHTFLDTAAGEGLVLGGVDAADLYIKMFPERYAAAIAQQKGQP